MVLLVLCLPELGAQGRRRFGALGPEGNKATSCFSSCMQLLPMKLQLGASRAALWGEGGRGVRKGPPKKCQISGRGAPRVYITGNVQASKSLPMSLCF